MFGKDKRLQIDLVGDGRCHLKLPQYASSTRDIFTDHSPGDAQGGSSVQGTVNLNLQKPMSVNKIEVILVGQVRTLWPFGEHNVSKTSTVLTTRDILSRRHNCSYCSLCRFNHLGMGGNMRDSYEEKVFFRDVLNVFEADQGNSDAEIRHNGSNGFSKLNGKKRAPSPVPVEFPSGLHKFDFTFLIPVECPETAGTDLFSVTWKVYAKVYKPSKNILSKENTLSVRRDVLVLRVPHETGGDFIAENSLTVDASAPHLGRYNFSIEKAPVVAGCLLPVNIQVIPNVDDLVVEDVRLIIEEVRLMTARDGLARHEEKHTESLYPVDPDTASIFPYSRRMFPADVMAKLNENGTYSQRLYFRVPGCERYIVHSMNFRPFVKVRHRVELRVTFSQMCHQAKIAAEAKQAAEVPLSASPTDEAESSFDLNRRVSSMSINSEKSPSATTRQAHLVGSMERSTSNDVTPVHTARSNSDVTAPMSSLSSFSNDIEACSRCKFQKEKSGWFPAEPHRVNRVVSLHGPMIILSCRLHPDYILLPKYDGLEPPSELLEAAEREGVTVRPPLYHTLSSSTESSDKEAPTPIDTTPCSTRNVVTWVQEPFECPCSTAHPETQTLINPYCSMHNASGSTSASSALRPPAADADTTSIKSSKSANAAADVDWCVKDAPPEYDEIIGRVDNLERLFPIVDARQSWRTEDDEAAPPRRRDRMQ